MNAGDPATYTIGYELEGVAARTDDSIVFAAVDRGSGRRVAIKVARDTRGADGLRREIQVLRGLRHPHVIEVIEATAVGQPWMVTALAPTTLENVIASGARFDPCAVAGVVVAIADALSSLHRHRFVHGDVKPSNILLGVDGRPVLADFGSAHPIGTAPNQFTPTYFVDDGPEGDTASLARCGLAVLDDDCGTTADALRAVLQEFARHGDRPDVFADAVTAMVDELRWPSVSARGDRAARGEPTLPYGSGPPRSQPTNQSSPRRSFRRVAALVACGTVVVVIADRVREQPPAARTTTVDESHRR